MTDVTREERGWAGHFIGARFCLFRRNTLLVCGETRIVVSTVGRMLDVSSQEFKPKFEPIGAGRYYETMAFHASKYGPYWEADVTREVSLTRIGPSTTRNLTPTNAPMTCTRW